MASPRDIETVLWSEDLPFELRRPSSAHRGEASKVATRLSGVIAGRQQDEVICPYLLRRNLVIPARLGPVALGYQGR